MCVKIGEILYWPFEETASDVGHWSTTVHWLPYRQGMRWTPFQTSEMLKWERIKDGDALKTAIDMAKGFTNPKLEENGFQKCFLLYSRADEYGHEDNTTVASVIRLVASVKMCSHHAPAMLGMLIAYPQKIPDVLADVKEWDTETVQAFVSALEATPIDSKLRIILLVETFAEKFPQLYEVAENMHRACIEELSLKYQSEKRSTEDVEYRCEKRQKTG